MKKTYKSSLLALSVLASFTSCSESESLQQANLSKDKITFHATLDNSWKPLSPASSSRAAIAAATEKGPIVVSTPFGKPLYLHSVVQDGIHIWSKEGKPITRSGAPLEDVEHERVAQTRGTMSTKTDLSDYNSFGVTAIYKEEENNVLLLDNAKAEKTDGEFWGFTNNSNARWPIGSTVSFHAYAPHSSADKSMLSYVVDKDHVQTQITYTASTTAEDIINQPDLIVATNTGSRQLSDAADAVQLDFHHALTAVSFAIDKDLADVVGKGGKMTSVTLKGIPNKGNCNLSVSATPNVPTAAWTIDNGTGEYTFDLSNANIVVGDKDQALTSDNQTLMMIPQTLPEGAELCFNLDMNGTTQEWKVPLKGQVWEAGKSIIYKLSSNSINMLDDAKIVYPDTWTAHSFPKISFGENDVVGLYVVNKFNQIVAENVQLTKTKGENNTFTWKTKDNKNFSFSADNKYFAYYPYSASMTKGEGTVTTATEFFKTKISSLSNDNNVVADQSAKETLLAQDFQVATGTIGPDAGSIVFNMEHQVGLAVLHMPSSQDGILVFNDDSYMYWYGNKRKRPQQGTNYTAWGIDGSTGQYFPSQKFTGNIPCQTGYQKVDDYNQWKRFSFVVPFGKTVKFQAEADPAEKRIENDWGKLFDISLTPNQNNPVVVQTVECDVPFKKIIREYKYKGSVETFTAPADETYTLQCWGAQGHNEITTYTTYYGGKGGYAVGNYKMTKGTNIYICVGGHNNGYNNKIPNAVATWWPGGGATSITTANRGELSNFDSRREEVLLVAGGGGAQDYGTGNPVAGVGGGSEGGTAYGSDCHGSGATQHGPGANGYRTTTTMLQNYPAGFGYGGVVAGSSPYGNDVGGQGGGGYYGGGGTQNNGPAGGGCGYFKNDALTNATTIAGNTEFPAPTLSTETGHSGHGIVQITLPMPKKNKP